jgi:hypothetical protein
MKAHWSESKFTAPQLFVHYRNIDSFINVISLLSFVVFSHCVIEVCPSISEEDSASIFRVTLVDVDAEVIGRKESRHTDQVIREVMRYQATL